MNKRRVVTVGAAVAALLVAFALLMPTVDITQSQFSAYGSSDADASLFVNGLRQQGYEVASLTLGTPALSGLDADRVDSFYVAVGPDRGFSATEARALEGFVEDGGVAFVLDDGGASDGLLERFGVQKGAALLATEGNPSVVQVTVGESLVNLWEPVELVVSEEADATVLASAGDRVAKDASGTGEIDEADPSCEDGCPVIVRVDRGAGSLFVIADATFATNQYAQGSGVIPLVAGLAEEHTTGQRAIVVADESRHVAGVAEVGLTVFRVVMAPLGEVWVASAIALAVVGAGAWAIMRREDSTWPEHDPGFDDPYLLEEAGRQEEAS